jgi:cytochrome P450
MTDKLDHGKTPDPADFSLFDPVVQSDPYPFYKALHEKCPVYKLPENGFYVLSKYEDVTAALRHYGTFSSVMERTFLLQGENSKVFLQILREKGWEHVPTLQRSDPPQHTRYRKIMDRAMNIKQVRNLHTRMSDVVRDLIDRFIDRGECDFIEEFAFPFPGTIIAELIGLDGRGWRQYRAWADNLLSYSTRVLTLDELRNAAEVEVTMQHFLAGILEDRRQNPREDLMTALVSAYEGEEPLTMHELQNVMHQLISGGYETVPSALNHAMLHLIQMPDVAARVRADPSLLRSFIDESIRWQGAVQGHVRVTKKDTEVRGVRIPAGSFCFARWGAANRDDDEFPNADRFELGRENANCHLGFGYGVHVCPGSMLARQELAIGIGALLERLDDIQLARPLPHPMHRTSIGFLPMKELHIRFRKRAA